MWIKTRRFGASPISCILLLLVISSFLFLTASATTGSNPARKLDQTAAPGPGEVKCGSCTTPAVTSPPPPPPSSPPPPPSPELCPPPPYVKPPKNPPSSNGGTPSPPSYMYITGPPGDLYPIDNDTNAAGRTGFAGILVGCALLLGLLVVTY